MPEFFQGWKRKVGCVTLAIALTCSVGWVRSIKNRESLYLTISNVRIAVISVDGRLGVLSVSHSNSLEKGFVWVTLPTASVYGLQHVDAALLFNVGQGSGSVFRSRWQFIGFDCGIIERQFIPMVQTQYLFAPYWSIAIPLTLLTTWLLLSKPPNTTAVRADEVA